MASTHHGVVYTKKWVVDLILDVAGYVPGTGISDKVIIEPSCGCGAFLTVIAGRLADDAIAVGKGWTSLGNAIRAYDIDSASIGFTVFRFFGISVSADSGFPVSAGAGRPPVSSMVRSRGRGVKFMFLTGPPPCP